jgi:TPR repeat protein
MKVNDYNSSFELPIGSYCYYITYLPTNTFAQVKDYYDTHSSTAYRKEMEDKYRSIINQSYDFRLQYETAKLIKVKDGYFVLEDSDGSARGVKDIFLSEQEMRSYWEQYTIAWKREQESTVKYIEDKFPDIAFRYQIELYTAILDANEAMEGIGVADALARLKALAELGNAHAEYILSLHYEKWDEGWCNSQSIKLITLSAEHGYANAQYKLGEWYRKPEHNDGVRGNIEEAAKWFKKAAEQGHTEAADALEHLASRRQVL